MNKITECGKLEHPFNFLLALRDYECEVWLTLEKTDLSLIKNEDNPLAPRWEVVIREEGGEDSTVGSFETYNTGKAVFDNAVNDITQRNYVPGVPE